jgi:predicted NodU family carbamoyl transferase
VLIMGVKPGHDGALAVIEDRRPALSLESEKDSRRRHCDLTPMTFLDVAERVGARPDVIGLGVHAPALRAVTHVDGSARARTVAPEDDPPPHALPTAFADRYGLGVPCDTSLNFTTKGFINETPELLRFSEAEGLDGMGVGDARYRRRDDPDAGG